MGSGPRQTRTQRDERFFMVLLKSIATVGGMTMVSRVLGFIRDILVAAVLGAGMAADAFFVAFKLPNLFRRLFAEGAFASAFVPLYAGTLETDGKDEARKFSSQSLSLLFWVLLGFVVVVEICMPWIMLVLAPGFADNPAQFELAVFLSRVTFPYLLFISLVALLGGLLNSHGRFAAAAAVPILLNVCLITAVLVFVPLTPTAAHALAYGVAAAGLLQFIWLWYFAVKAGIAPNLAWPKLTDKVRTLLKRIVPVAIGAGIYQVNLVVDTIIASLLPVGSISFLFYADRVNQLPLGVVGVAVGTALLPLLTRQLKSGDMEAAHHSQNRAVEFALFLTLPAAMAFLVIAEPVIVTLFQRGAFGIEEAQATAQALTIYALGLPAYVLVKALSPGFFAREDTATPVKIAVVAMVVNIVLNLLLMGPLLHVGIAVATAASAWTNAVLLGVILYRRGHFRIDDRLKSRLPRSLAATIVMGLALWGLLEFVGAMIAGGEVERALGLGVLVATGLITYFVMAQVLGAAKLSEVKGLMRRSS